MATHRVGSVRVVLSTLLVGAVALAPVTEANASPLGHKLRRVMTLQPEESAAPAGEAPAGGEAGEVAAAPEGPAPAPAAAPAEAPAGPPPRKGLGMMITGAVITGAYALPMLAAGTVLLVASSRVSSDASPGDEFGGGIGVLAVAMGLIGLAVGAPLLGVGAYRFSKYRQWKAGQSARFVPTAGRTAFGTVTPGLVFRF